MVYAALVFGDANHLISDRSFYSGDYSCLSHGFCVPRTGPAKSRDYWFESQRARYLSTALLLAGIWLLLLCGSHSPTSSQIATILEISRSLEMKIGGVLLRPALFTQTLYLSACICTASFFRFFFGEEWMRYVFGAPVPRALWNLRGSTSWFSKNPGTLSQTGCMATIPGVGRRQCKSDLSRCYGSNRPSESLPGFQPRSSRISSSRSNTGEGCWP